MTIFPVTMCGLILIHKVHIDGVIGNLLIKLRVEMAKGLIVLLQAHNPHLCRGKGMHPGDDAGTILIVIGLMEGTSYGCLINQSRLPHKLEGKLSGGVQTLHHFAGMICYLAQTLVTVQIL